ncbi:MAG: radical SAM protein [Fretibacterium sp.]|nr:radical SAM protein [Fretibacterium sp.]
MINLPKPSANQEEYQRIFNEGMMRFPKRKENYKQYETAVKKQLGLMLDYMPVKMDYEVSSLCNFRCEMCLMSEIAENHRTQMTYADFKRSLDEQYGLVEVKLQGLGEPLLNPDFFAMVHEAVSRDLWVRTTTNGSLLHLNENYKKMIDEKIGEIQISIDGATKEVFEKIRRGADFDRIVENVSILNHYAITREEQWRTSCWMLVQKDNIHEMRALLDLAEKIGFSRVVYSLALGNWGKDNWSEINNPKDVRSAFHEEDGWELVDAGQKKGISVSFWVGNDKYRHTEDGKQLCNWLWSRAFISGDMRIVPCCVLCDANTFDLGDALDFSKEWNSKDYQELRRQHLTGEIPSMCRNCYEGSR